MAAASSWREETEIAGWWRAVACTRGRLSVVDTVYTKQPRVIWRPRISVESNLGCHNRNVLATLRCYCYCCCTMNGATWYRCREMCTCEAQEPINTTTNQPTKQTANQPHPPNNQTNRTTTEPTNQLLMASRRRSPGEDGTLLRRPPSPPPRQGPLAAAHIQKHTRI